MTPENPIEWLLDSDPAIRWQVMRDLLDVTEAEYAVERARVETEGWGAKLLSVQDADGQWAGGAFLPVGFTRAEWKEQGQPWTATCFSLNQLHEFGLDPKSASARRTVELVGGNCHWEEGGQPYWHGETEECINGRTVADGAYFGVDVSDIVSRLLDQRQVDGGWNCERTNGSICSSFASTINVLEGLLEYERATGGTPETRDARRSERNISFRGTCIVVSVQGSQRMNAFSHCFTPVAGDMMCCARLTISGPQHCSLERLLIED